MKRSFWIPICLLALLAAWLLWPAGERPLAAAKKSTVASAPASSVAAIAAVAVPVVTNNLSVAPEIIGRSAASTNREFFRLSNTTKTLDELTTAPRAILLENALVDTASQMDLKIPAHLRAPGEPGAYIVQARGMVDAAFRAALANAGAQIVSYIPNNAYLVQLSAGGAAVLQGNAEVAAVLPFAPYFKLQSSLLGLAVEQKALPPGQVLTLGLFPAGANATVAQIENMGGVILASDRSPFGPIVRVRPPADWIALAQLPGVQRVEPATRRVVANDLARVTMGITTATYVTNANWLGLSGSNVVVEVNDTGIDATHKDFSVTGSASAPGANPPTRVSGDTTNSLVDTDGHGTHVAGIIAGNGSMSFAPVNVGANARGSVTNADFRGKAPAAKLFSVAFLGANDTNLNYTQPTLDSYLQEMPALTNALISNNSWVNGGANEYDLSAASYDAAVRDALPGTTGPQPVLFVFAAGNDGGGDDNGVNGSADTILSPGTAKNVVTVGALEQLRDITNQVVALDGTTNTIWQAGTSSSSQVASYSARGNVGVQTEGTYGRFKPDVVAPGTFVVSTRSQEWDTAAYYDPTNFDTSYSSYGLTVDTNNPAYGFANVAGNASGVTIQVVPNSLSPSPMPDLPIYISATGVPDPTDPTTYDFVKTNLISIPPDGGAGYLGNLLNGGFTCAVGVGTNLTTVNFDLVITIATTNDNGNELTVLSNLNNTLGPDYRYETGTSMAAPAVSGALALLQDYFTNTLHTTPSPALLKAMVINGARLTSGYNFYGVTNAINYEGWGLVNVPNSVPLALTNATGGVSNTVPMYFLDQSPANALATGDHRTFNVTVPTANARAQQMHITLAWTDPPGNPAAGIKLVNNLDLVVTNLGTGEVFYGNNFVAGQNPHSAASNSNSVADSINNVESVILQSGLGTNYSVAVVGHNVAVNAVTTEQTNVVQDFALVISCGNGANTNGITVTPVAPSLPTLAQNVTFVSATNGVYYDQIAGANAPWLSTNAVMFGTNSVYTTNDSLYIGQTNQWHFFVVTNTTPYTNAAFIIFLPETLATPREGVFETSTANSTLPEANLDLFVAGPADANASSLTNLNPLVISNCVYGTNGDQASLARGGTKFIVYNNAQLGQVFYVGVQCEDQMAADFGFLPIFSQNAFSQIDSNGNEVVTGLLLPASIPDGNNAHPGHYFTLGLATIPMTVGGLTVSNTIATQNYGDLIGVLTHDSAFATLNNHTGPTDPGTYTTVYNDDGLPNTTHTDGPGSLRDFRGQQAIGPWILTEIDDAASATGAITSFTIVIEPHKDLTKGLQQVTVQPLSWYYGYVDVPVGYTNITVVATNITIPPQLAPPVQLYLNYAVEPDFTNYLAETNLDSGLPPGNLISYGPPMQPGRYFVGLYNPSATAAETILIGVTLGYAASAITTVDAASTDTPLPLKDDAVTYDYINVTNTDLIQDFNVGLRVDHPRISDLVFHLISPDGTRYLLMENRGGQTTNGCGASYTITNVVPTSSNGGPQASTNIIDTGVVPGAITINYDFFRVPDRMVVYDGTNVLYDTGMVSGSGVLNLVNTASTIVTIVMNPGGNTNRVTAWKYTAITTQARYAYLTFTEDASLTTTPIKFATPPFVPMTSSNQVAFADDFEAYSPGTYTNNFGGWSLLSTNPVNILTNPAAYSGTNFLAISNGVVAITLPTVAGQKYSLAYALGSLSSESGPPTNANWTSTSFTFTAVTNATPLVFAASGTTFTSPGNAQTVTVDSNAVIDAIALTEFPATLYYQPEQDISGLQGTSPTGKWALEILDNRAGATNVAPQLVSWNLEFQFANTNFIVAPKFVATPTNVVMVEQTTNFVSNPATTIYGTNITLTYSLVDPPSWATINTNTGLITLTPGEADGPTNVIIVTLVTDSHVPPQTATNSFSVTVLESNRPPVLTFPTNGAVFQILETVPFVTTATATDPDIPVNPLTFALVSATNTFGQSITNALTITANGVISWTPDETNGPSTNIILISVTDTNQYNPVNTNTFTVTNAFTIIVLESNLPPTLLLPPNTNIDEMVPWTATATATDQDYPSNALTFALVGVSPALTGSLLTVSNNGVINWTPSELQGPGDYIVFVSVTDTNPWAVNTNTFTVTSSFTIHVNEVNVPPVLLGIANTNIFELSPLTVPVTANDPDYPTNTLTYALAVNVDTNATIANGWSNSLAYATTNPPPQINPTNGVITWTPTELQGPAVYDVTVFVTDTNLFALTNQTYTVSTNFTITVLETNSAPFWTNSFPTVTMNELTTNTVNATAQDADLPTNILSYTLTNSPVWAVIDTNSGVITLTPLETNGPSTNTITVIVTDNGSPQLSATTNFTVIVDEVNTAPYWLTNIPSQTNYVINEQTPLTVTNTASDSDIPANVLTYTLTVVSTNISDPAVTNAAIDPNGVITWTPTEAQGPGFYTFTTIVTDTNIYALTNQSLSATNSFTVTVNEVNTAPFWTNGFANVTMNESNVLSITNLATDLDIPTNTLTYALTNSPAWAVIDTNSGVITLTPLEADGPSTNLITVIVTDNGAPPLSATTNFTVVVNEVNTAPYWSTNVPSQTNYVINEQTLLTVTNTAQDSDIPLNPLTYALVVSPAATNAAIDPNGVITWTPTEAQGPGFYTFTTVVTDTNIYALANQSLSATNSFTVTVNEVNTAPYWTNNFPTVTMNELTTNSVNATAQDSDIPTNTLTYTLTNSPAWAVIDTNSGVIILTPLEADGPSTNVITVIVTDNGAPPLSATTNFTVIVNEVNVSPVLVFPANAFVTNILETVPFTLQAVATDADIPTNQLTFALVSATNLFGQSITNALTVTTNGLISWTPDETNGPSTNIVLVSVTDTNVYALTNQSYSVTNAFTIIVLESNLPPTLFLPPNTNIDEMVPWTATATATDPDYPANALTFALVSGPAGLNVLPNGVINWTPDETNGPGDYTIFVSVTDTNPWAVNQTSFSVTNSFAIHVNEVNTAPYWTNNFPPVTMDELTVSNVNAAAQDLDIPTNTLTYTLTNSPAWAVIDTNSGIITLSPLEADGPSTNVITVIVMDNGSPQLSATTNFTVIVNEVNTAPVFKSTPANQTIAASTTFTVTNGATDSDIPTNTLTYTLLTAPAGMNINSGSGIITWTPLTTQASTVNPVITVVTDNGVPPLSATNQFFVTVSTIPVFSGASFGASGMTLQWTGLTNEQFQVQWTTNLAPPSWTLFPDIITSTNGTFSFTDTNSPMVMKFYQLLLLP